MPTPVLLEAHWRRNIRLPTMEASWEFLTAPVGQFFSLLPPLLIHYPSQAQVEKSIILNGTTSVEFRVGQGGASSAKYLTNPESKSHP